MIPADVDRSDDYKAGYEDACKKWADLIVERLYPNLDPGERWLISDGMSDLLPCIQPEPMAENVALRTERDEYAVALASVMPQMSSDGRTVYCPGCLAPTPTLSSDRLVNHDEGCARFKAETLKQFLPNEDGQ